MTTDEQSIWKDVTSNRQKRDNEKQYLRQIDSKCWISVLYRKTGFGWPEWETALVFMLEPDDRVRRGEWDDRDCLIIRGDWREELATMPKCELKEWYKSNINGNKNSIETLLEALKNKA